MWATLEMLKVQLSGKSRQCSDSSTTTLMEKNSQNHRSEGLLKELPSYQQWCIRMVKLWVNIFSCVFQIFCDMIYYQFYDRENYHLSASPETLECLGFSL